MLRRDSQFWSNPVTIPINPWRFTFCNPYHPCMAYLPTFGCFYRWKYTLHGCYGQWHLSESSQFWGPGCHRWKERRKHANGEPKPGIDAVTFKLPSRDLTYPTLGKRKIIFKMPFLGDMLVPWRVCFLEDFFQGKTCCFFLERGGWWWGRKMGTTKSCADWL